MPRPNNETRNHLQGTVKNIHSVTLMITCLSMLLGLAYSVVHKTCVLLSIKHLCGVYMRYTNHIADKTFQHTKSLLEQGRMKNKLLQKELPYSHLESLQRLNFTCRFLKTTFTIQVDKTLFVDRFSPFLWHITW